MERNQTAKETKYTLRTNLKDKDTTVMCFYK